MASLGQELRRERELRGISLKEISDSTKISLRYLRALEDDQLDVLPGQFFTKSIIRGYAQYCGLEEETVLNKYYEETQFKDQILEEERKKRKTQKAFPLDMKRIFPYVLILILLSVVILAMVYLLPMQEKTNQFAITPIPVLLFTENRIPPPLDTLLAHSFPGEKLYLDIFFVQKTWLQVYVDGKLSINGLKHPGEMAKLRAFEEILLHLGNAGGITYSLNNELGRPFGRSKAVVKNIKITPSNLQEFLAQD